MSFSHLTDKQLAKVFSEGADDAASFQAYFCNTDDQDAAMFCHRMIERLREGARRMNKVYTGEDADSENQRNVYFAG